MEIASYLVLGIWSSYVDVRIRRVPNKSVVVFAAVFILQGKRNWSYSLLVALLLVLLRAISNGGLGFGDIKLSMALALHCLNFASLTSSLLYSFLAAAIGLGLAAIFRRTWPRSLPMAPFLWLGFLTSL